MPSVWAGVDTNFPTFRDNEPIESKFKKIVNYMYVLTEQLKYTLNNLDSTNFNGKALEDLSDETTETIGEELEAMQNRINSLAVVIGSLNSRITTVEGYSSRITDIENSVAGLTTRMNDTETAVNSLINNVSALIELITASGSTVSIGGTGKTVNLLGTVNVNGTPI